MLRELVHEQAETLLQNLRRRRKAMRDEPDALVAAAVGPGTTPAMRTLVNEHRALDVEIARVRHSLIPLRHRHLENVKAALRGPARAAAERALAAIAELESAAAELNAMRAEIRAVGGQAPDLAAAKIVVPLVLHLRRIVGETA